MTEPTLSPIGPDPGVRTVGSATDRLGELDARQLKEKLVEAELLLNYAVATGRQVEGAVISGVLEGGAASRSGWTERTATNLLVAEATLAAMLKPVSAESLRNTASYRSRRYRFLLPTTMAGYFASPA